MFTITPVGEQFVSLGDHVYDVLLQAIVQRQLKPGDRLVLDDLAAQLRVSRTPVRDALNRLTTEGLIQPVGRRGFRVAALSAEDLRQLYDLRWMYERHAVEVGMGNASAALLDRLESLADEISRQVESEAPVARLLFSQRDGEFHRLIVGLANNPRLLHLFERLNVHIHAIQVGPAALSPPVRAQVHRAEHLEIIQALRSADVALARQAVGDHIEKARDRALLALQHWQENESAPGSA